jgi:hypothetical protein
MEGKLADEQRSMDALMRIEAGHQDARENSLDGLRSKLKDVYGEEVGPDSSWEAVVVENRSDTQSSLAAA